MKEKAKKGTRVIRKFWKVVEWQNKIAERINGMEEKKCTHYRMECKSVSTLFCTVPVQRKVKTADESVQIIYYLAQFVHQPMESEGGGCWGVNVT